MNTEVSSSTNELENSHVQSNEDTQLQNLWQVAYGNLTDSDHRILSSAQFNNSGPGRPIPIDQVLDEVIHITKERYEEYQKRSSDNVILRNAARNILNATLSFKDTVSAIVSFDPTGHASSAWMIVSLGLTMTKNYYDLRNALFESSEFLAESLARYSYIQKNFYDESHLKTKTSIRNAIVRVYTAILHYSVELQKIQQANRVKQVLGSVTATTDHPLSKLKSVIDDEERNLQKWVQIDQHLQHKEEAEGILARIDVLIKYVRDSHQASNISKLPIAKGAFFDSYIDQHESLCLPGTRTELLQQIAEWAQSPDGKCIYWLNGVAGTGKSTISRTMARSFQEKGLLGASFFFKRGEKDRGSVYRLISTIVSQLVHKIPQLVSQISNAIENDPNIASKSLQEQFDKLLLQPLLTLDSPMRQPETVVLVIDALDECDGEKDIKLLLRLLPQTQKSRCIRFRTLLTSRPESPMRLGFRKMENEDHQDVLLHEIPRPVIEHDIALFLQHQFSQIRENNLLPPEWPGESVIQELMTLSVPLFISAATVCLFVGESRWDAEERLTNLLKDQSSYASKMEKTYMPIMKQLLVGQDEEESKQLVQEFQKIIGAIILLATPLSVHTLSQLLNIKPGTISKRLDFFHSVLSIPSDPTLPIRTLHLSFRDFLLDSKRIKSPFWVNEKEKHQEISHQCLNIMRHRLKRNICDLPNEGILLTEIDEQTIDKNLPPVLQYSCRYWTTHLLKSDDLNNGMDGAFSFLQEHFLHWLEVMSIIGAVSEAIEAISMLQSVKLEIKTGSPLSKFLRDGKQFVLNIRQIVDTAPLQFYCSGLIFAPEDSVIKQTFKKDLPTWIERLPKIEEPGSGELQTLEGHSHMIHYLTFSQDGKSLASISFDQTVKFWDTVTGALQQTLELHPYSCLAISPDFTSLLLISKDGIFKIHNVITSSFQDIPSSENVASALNGIPFSPDGQLIALKFSDDTIRIWNIATGAWQEGFNGVSSTGGHKTFSPNGQQLASHCRDNTIKLWDTATGHLERVFVGHSGPQCLVFSPDGQLLASGFSEGVIKLWDVHMGTLSQTFYANSGPITSLSFSHDCHLLVSGSADKTIRLWDIRTGALRCSLKGHEESVSSVAFSPNSQLIASGSNDFKIKFWDTNELLGISMRAGALQQTPEGHNGLVFSLAFSPANQLLASAGDGRIKLWDLTKYWDTGAERALQHTFWGYSRASCALALSPDGRLLASASDEIKIWDTATGVLLHTMTYDDFEADPKLSENRVNLSLAVLGPYLKFSQDGLYLKLSEDDPYVNTNFRILNIGPWYNPNTLPLFQNTIEIFVPSHWSSYAPQGQRWIAIQGKEVLWLPPNYRATCSTVGNDGTVVLGHYSGTITPLKFRV
ncbi:quinon protein alcohol dehydrogenase-like superfamily [Talaromyces proteolyticus]|uniref:Quinon protein alcohol dehydrogenase-like superfamily n=1 Tax=Talaromyces proteolyticus TaxID=1131652 RepID=A0AAD4L0J5_9EURO|nr:quinon protein alcohol dehydrogenase-like superfamily [Talaromyces proteolyticus]KAH8704003.1 quinon protein alcohol dehydrogenase-like superfamily [Talaromyces proteolyticus]